MKQKILFSISGMNSDIFNKREGQNVNPDEYNFSQNPFKKLEFKKYTKFNILNIVRRKLPLRKYHKLTTYCNMFNLDFAINKFSKLVIRIISPKIPSEIKNRKNI